MRRGPVDLPKRTATASVGEVLDEVQVREVTLAPEAIAGTALRGTKLTQLHKPATNTKRGRVAAATVFEGMNADDGGPGPAGTVFSALELEEPDNPMDVGLLRYV